MRIADHVRGSTLLLVLLLTTQLVLTIVHADRAPFGDEIYWVGKARHLVEHGTLPRIERSALEVERGERRGNADWRPQAYTFFVAACSLGDFDTPGLRRRVAAVQALLLVAILITLHLIAVRSGLSPGAHWVAAMLLGGTPWVFAFAELIGDGVLNGIVMTVGLLTLWRWISVPTTGTWTVLAGALLTSSTLLIRPEMIILAPMAIATAMLLRKPAARHVTAAALGLLLPLATQVGYRTWATERPGVFGGYRAENYGAFSWANTWFGTEKEGYDFVTSLTNGSGLPLPARAFTDPSEKSAVETIVLGVERRGRYTAEDDAAFERLAAERRARQPVATSLLRIWHAVHLWVNVENPSYLLETLVPVPRGVRRPFYGALFALKLAILAASVVAMVRSAIALARGEADSFDKLTLLLGAFVVTRTLLIGVALNWKTHRFVIAAWPSLMWCATYVLRRRAAHSSPRQHRVHEGRDGTPS